MPQMVYELGLQETLKKYAVAFLKMSCFIRSSAGSRSRRDTSASRSITDRRVLPSPESLTPVQARAARFAQGEGVHFFEPSSHNTNQVPEVMVSVIKVFVKLRKVIQQDEYREAFA